MKQNLVLLLSVFHFSVERHVSESPRIYKLKTDIYVVTGCICSCECVVNDCVNYARCSAVEAAIDGRQPKVGPIHRVAATKGSVTVVEWQEWKVGLVRMSCANGGATAH